MKKVLLILAFLASVIGVQAQTTIREYESREDSTEYKISRLPQDVDFEFIYKHDVKYTSALDEATGLWKVRIDEIFPPTPTKNSHINIYLLKLDEGCVPGDKLDNFIIKGHKFTIKLIKKEK